MTKRNLTTTTAAFAVLLAGAAGAQSLGAEADANARVNAEAPSVSQSLENTAEGVTAAGERALDGVAAGVESTAEAAGTAATGAYEAGSDLAARLDAALTQDAVVIAADGGTVGTIERSDMDGDRVLIDLDSAMETEFATPVEKVVVSKQSLGVGAEGVTLDMDRAQFAARIAASAEAQARASGG
ncbi:hypothetical protein [Roseivivax sp. CAU 1761]